MDEAQEEEVQRREGVDGGGHDADDVMGILRVRGRE